MSWFERLKLSQIRTAVRRHSVPEGLWTQCEQCHAALYRAELERNLNVCPKCGHHKPLRARRRLETLLDEASGVELAADLEPLDFLKFRDGKKYKDRLTQAQKNTGEKDALIAMQGRLKDIPVIVAAFEFEFMGGSMGSVVGERFVRAADCAFNERIPLICFTASGGARMQESLVALFQMAKTSAAIARLSTAGIPYITVLTHPTTGGVAASLAMLGDIQLAEPQALIGFAGPRVIEQTVREKLPEGFQRSEFLQDHGMIDRIVDRRQLRDVLAALLALLTHRPAPDPMMTLANASASVPAIPHTPLQADRSPDAATEDAPATNPTATD